jgi:replicative DNA helicase
MSSAPPTLEEASVDSQLDRLPPHSLPAEEGILGCVMLSYRESLDACARIPSPDAFYCLANRMIYEAMLEMDQGRTAIDVITLQSHLNASGNLDAVGGLSRLAALSDCVPSAANVSYYIGILLESYAKRMVIQVATDAIQSAYESNDSGLLVDEFERSALSIRRGDLRGDKSNKEVLVTLIEDLQQESNGVFKEVINTGIHDFDKRYRGFSPGELVLIAARPSVGKTNMLLQMALNMAKIIPVGFSSLEMPHAQLTRRQLSNLAEFDLRHIANAQPSDNRRIVIAAARIKDLPIHVSDLPSQTIRQIAHKARQWVSAFGIKVLFVDYIQLVKGSSKRARDDRRLEIAEISAGLKGLAKDLHIAIIAAAQLSRQVEQRATNSRPRLSDLREAGELEADADWVNFLWKGKQKDDEAEGDSVCITMTIAKNRSGPTGDIELIHHKPTGRFLPKTNCNDESYATHP